MIEFDTEISLPAVMAERDGPTYAPTDRPWSIVIRLDGVDAAEMLGPDVIAFPSLGSFPVNALALRTDGFGPVNELALASWSLQRAGDPRRILFSVSTLILMETAKLRAFRVLHPDVEIWAIGDIRNLSAEDVASNGIRTTLQTVAAIWGTADRVCILPANAPGSGYSDPEAARLAANIGRMMREESFSDEIPDPTAGSMLLDTAVTHLVDAVRTRTAAFNATGAQTLNDLLSHEDVIRLRNQDRAWWGQQDMYSERMEARS